MTENDKLSNSADLRARAREALTQVPFIANVQPVQGGARWSIRTSAGDEHLLELTFDPRLVRPAPTRLLVVERTSPAKAAAWAEAGINYVDAAGNVHLTIGDRLHVHVEGKRPPSKTRAMRAPAYRVLLAWLLDPSLVGQSVRATAAVADVSRTAVQHMRTRLQEWGYVVGHAERRVWSARGQKEARRMWLEGYRTTLRPALNLGRYRLTQRDGSGDIERTRALLEAHRAAQVDGAGQVRWMWAGSEALNHIPAMKHYFVDPLPQVHIHIDPRVKDASDVLPIVSQEGGEIRLVTLPFPAAGTHESLPDWPASVPHPLMVWSELSCESDPRAHEAAARLLESLPRGHV